MYMDFLIFLKLYHTALWHRLCLSPGIRNGVLEAKVGAEPPLWEASRRVVATLSPAELLDSAADHAP